MLYSRDEYKLVWVDKNGVEHKEYYYFSDQCDMRLREIEYVEYHIYAMTTYCLNRF